MENFMRCLDLFNKYFGNEFTVEFVDTWNEQARKYVVRVTETATGFTFNYVCGACELTHCDVRSACAKAKKDHEAILAFTWDWCKGRGFTPVQMETLRKKLARELQPAM